MVVEEALKQLSIGGEMDSMFIRVASDHGTKSSGKGTSHSSDPN